MVYMGSKSRHAKELLKIMLADQVLPDGSHRAYVEPFCGGCNVIDKANVTWRIAGDSNEYLIRMWDNLQFGWQPPEECSQEFYNEVRDNRDKYPAHLVGYIGFNASYNGKFFGGWTGSYTARNYYAEKRRNIMSQLKGLRGVTFLSLGYLDLPIPGRAIVYCDPPYAGSTQYKDKFDNVQFWDWAKEQSLRGRKVFVSEYTAPDGWTSVWEKQVNSSLTQDTGSKKAIEKLFIYG